MGYHIISRTLISAAIIAMLFTFITISCNSPSGPGCGPFPDRFRITDFSASIHQITHFDSSTYAIQLSEIKDDSIQYDQFAIKMSPVTEVFYSSYLDKIKFQLIRNVYACSPIDPISDETILDIQIFSDNDFSPEHPAGENLAELFDVYALYLRDGPRLVDLNEFLTEEPNAPDYLVLLLKSGPSEADEFIFSVRYVQDGEKLNEFEFSSTPIIITP